MLTEINIEKSTFNRPIIIKTEIFFGYIPHHHQTLKNIDIINENIRICCNRLVHFHFITIIAAQIKNEMNNKLGHYGHHHHTLFIGRP